MATFLRSSTLWVIDYHYDGRPRRWFKTFGSDVDVPSAATGLLRDLYGERAQLVEARQATAHEELQYLRGEEPGNAYCPTGRHS